MQFEAPDSGLAGVAVDHLGERGPGLAQLGGYLALVQHNEQVTLLNRSPFLYLEGLDHTHQFARYRGRHPGLHRSHGIVHHRLDGMVHRNHGNRNGGGGLRRRVARFDLFRTAEQRQAGNQKRRCHQIKDSHG